MEEKDFSTIILSKSGDYLTESEEQIEKNENGVEISNPYVFNEAEKAQKVKAEKVFVPYHAVEAIQKGSFKQETM